MVAADHRPPSQLQHVGPTGTQRTATPIRRRTPRSVFDAREKAEPTAPLITINDRRLRLDKVDSAGSVTLRHKGRLHHIGVGRAYAGWRVAMLIEGLDIEVVGLDGSPLRHLVLDPTMDYQRMA
jgi:hypothetical protein